MSVLLALALAASPALKGDARNGAALFRIECTACHGADRRGDGPLGKQLSAKPENLRDAQLVLSLPDADMAKEISEGIVSMSNQLVMPGFGHGLTPLDIGDLVAFVRAGVIGLADVYPQAARYTTKRYQVDEDGQRRYVKAVGESLAAGEQKVKVTTAYKGAGEGTPLFVAPDDNRGLDTLKKKDKLGYLVFAELPVGVKDAPEQVALAIGDDGALLALEPTNRDAPDRAAVVKRLEPYVGQSGGPERHAIEPKAKGKARAKAKPDALSKALTRAYYRAEEGIAMAKKDEFARSWAD